MGAKEEPNSGRWGRGGGGGGGGEGGEEERRRRRRKVYSKLTQ